MLTKIVFKLLSTKFHLLSLFYRHRVKHIVYDFIYTHTYISLCYSNISETRLIPTLQTNCVMVGFCICNYYNLVSEISPIVCQNSFTVNPYCISGTAIQNQSSHRNFERSYPLFYLPQAKLLPISWDRVLFLIAIWPTSSIVILLWVQIILEIQTSFKNMKAFITSNNLKETTFAGLQYHFRLMLT